MTEQTTDRLIGSLTQDLAPVRPLRPPALRAVLWLAPVALIAAAAVSRWANLGQFVNRYSDSRMALQCAAIALTAVTGIVAAFYLSLPDRSSLWRYAPLPPLALWIATSGLGCWDYGVGLGPAGDRIGTSAHCFRFILMLSIPLAVLLYAVLRRARPLATLPVSLTAALGIAALAAFMLQFFHPFDTTLVDLAAHLCAVAVVMGLASLARRALA